ncbi:MAG TPA: glucose-6-phosphate isomerase, partial [Thermomonospora sp.]|nr:glucose-6-phosphate isomerase [Thermomonospora sp.]
AALAARCARPVAVRRRTPRPSPNDRRKKGVYLMLTGNVLHDVPVADTGRRLGRFQLAQAAREARDLRRGGLPVVRLHLHDRWAGLAQLLEAARGDT